MTSREIADLTGKRHPDVTRDIEKMLIELQEDRLNFQRIYLDTMNREQREYVLDRELTDTLLTGRSSWLAALCEMSHTTKRWYLKTSKATLANGGGTWLHPKLAVRFAQWLDPKFAVWCDQSDIHHGHRQKRASDFTVIFSDY
jgi:hypothetical protein